MAGRKSKKGGLLQTVSAPVARVWNTAVYARLSVEDSGRKGADTIETQIELVSSYVSQHSYLSLADTYVDNGESGKDFNRPSWNRLMDDVRAGRVDCIVVKDLSRFSRNYIETLEFLEKIFPFMGVRFVSVNDGYDNEAPGNQNEALMIALKALIHDRHLKEISRKICESKKAIIERGEHMGAAPYGYKVSDTQKGKLIPDEETAPIVRQIFQWRAEGLGCKAICNKLLEMGVSTPIRRRQEKFGTNKTDFYKAVIWRTKAITQIIRNRVYIGYLEQGRTSRALYENKSVSQVPKSEWRVTENAHEPLVSMELWEAARAFDEQQRTKHFETYKPAELPQNIFKGYLVCGCCGNKLVRSYRLIKSKNGSIYEYYSYICSLHQQHDKTQNFRRVNYNVLYGSVFPLVTQKLGMAANLGSVIEKRAKRQANPRAVLDSEIARLSHELETITQKQSKLYEDYADKLLSEMEYVKIKANYESKSGELRYRMDTLSQKAAVVADVSASENRWLKAARDFQNPTELTREMIEALVDRIVVSGSDKIEVVWKFNDDFALLKDCADIKSGRERV